MYFKRTEMSNEIKYSKTFTFGGDKNTPKYKAPTNQEIIEDILKVPAVTMKGRRDELIKCDLTLEEPEYKWNEEFLQTMDNYSLIILKSLIIFYK